MVSLCLDQGSPAQRAQPLARLTVHNISASGLGIKTGSISGAKLVLPELFGELFPGSSQSLPALPEVCIDLSRFKGEGDRLQYCLFIHSIIAPILDNTSRCLASSHCSLRPKGVSRLRPVRKTSGSERGLCLECLRLLIPSLAARGFSTTADAAGAERVFRGRGLGEADCESRGFMINTSFALTKAGIQWLRIEPRWRRCDAVPRTNSLVARA